jgi:hypothetical protein
MKRSRSDYKQQRAQGGAEVAGQPRKRNNKSLEVVIHGFGAIPYEDARKQWRDRKIDSSGRFDPCWICGSAEHKRSGCPHKLIGDGHSVQRKLICLGCRRRGHVLAECPDKGAASAATRPVCFNCGSVDHRLHECTEARMGTGVAFASCFVCNAKGHLSKDCPSNKHGMYPRGGGCKHCGSNEHLVKDCQTHASRGAPLRPTETLRASEEAPNIAPAAPAKRLRTGGDDDLDGNFASLRDSMSDEEEIGLAAAARPKKAFYKSNLKKHAKGRPKFVGK